MNFALRRKFVFHSILHTNLKSLLRQIASFSLHLKYGRGYLLTFAITGRICQLLSSYYNRNSKNITRTKLYYSPPPVLWELYGHLANQARLCGHHTKTYILEYFILCGQICNHACVKLRWLDQQGRTSVHWWLPVRKAARASPVTLRQNWTFVRKCETFTWWVQVSWGASCYGDSWIEPAWHD